MVGQTVLKTGELDVKSPPKSTLTRGWRPPPWKTRRVDLVRDGEIIELSIYKQNSDDLVRTYQLTNISDITMVTSKTHLHAFEIISAGESLIVMSGSTELESRDWIWTLRKLFWPDALEHIDTHDKICLKLILNDDTKKIRLSDGVYDLRVTTVSIVISHLHRGDSRATPVEPFDEKEAIKSVNLPLVHIARFKLEKADGRVRLMIETIPESKYGSSTFVFEETEESSNLTAKEALNILKSSVFTATNSLHDCIASSKWTFDEQS
ncbi:uncharacterized protein LOC132749313 [Ruditapes philippinarum]|uniref:uncharacterized protein LOC132749313 n=1 Tax=Ruditapes philippinarum TaxID=129788 RepID=UPI00295ADEAD|nr:uncharacterized protein LOC132749313 [Ruditapes philippinarum]